MDTPLKANVKVVTADTKLVDKGKGDGMFVNTSDIGMIAANLRTTVGRLGDGLVFGTSKSRADTDK